MKKMLLLLIIFFFIPLVSSYTSNVFLGLGDSVVYGVRSGVLLNDTFVYQSSVELSTNHGYTSMGYDNNGVSASCLTDGSSCSSRSPVINRYVADLITVDPRVGYFLPNINDLEYNPVHDEYETDFNIVMDAALENNITMITSTLVGLSEENGATSTPDIRLRETIFNNVAREYAIVNELPFFEAGFLINHNGSLLTDTLHLNPAGHDVITDAIVNSLVNDTFMTIYNYTFYDDCNQTNTFFDFSIRSDLNCFPNTSTEWNILTNMTHNQMFTERLDQIININVSNIPNSTDFMFTNNTKNKTSILQGNENDEVNMNITMENQYYYYKQMNVDGPSSGCWICDDTWLACLDNEDGGLNIADRDDSFLCNVTTDYPIIRSGESALIRNISQNENDYFRSDVGDISEI